MVEYGAENGFDVRRRLYHHYLLLAADLQQIFIQELYALTPVPENNIVSLFSNVERITELYTTAGKADNAIDEKWITVAVLRGLPKIIIKDLAMQFKDAEIVNEVRSIINIYMHDHQTGKPRGQSGPMLCMAAEGQTEQTEDKTNIANNTSTNSVSSSVHPSNGAIVGEVNAAT